MTSTECDPGAVCVDGRCRPCLEDTECSNGLVCLDGRCDQPECGVFADCDPLEQTCVDHRCVSKPCANQVFTFSPEGDGYERVLVAGEFTDWLDGARPMIRLNDGRWVAQIPLENGRYAYKFVAYRDGVDTPEWLPDPTATESTPDGVGGHNSIRIVDCQGDIPGFGRCGDPTVSDWRDDENRPGSGTFGR